MIEEILQNTTPIGVIGILIYIVFQLLDRFVFSKPTKDRVLKLETNHIPHIEIALDEIRKEQVTQGNRLTRLETLIEKE